MAPSSGFRGLLASAFVVGSVVSGRRTHSHDVIPFNTSAYAPVISGPALTFERRVFVDNEMKENGAWLCSARGADALRPDLWCSSMCAPAGRASCAGPPLYRAAYPGAELERCNCNYVVEQPYHHRALVGQDENMTCGDWLGLFNVGALTPQVMDFGIGCDTTGDIRTCARGLFQNCTRAVCADKLVPGDPTTAADHLSCMVDIGLPRSAFGEGYVYEALLSEAGLSRTSASAVYSTSYSVDRTVTVHMGIADSARPVLVTIAVVVPAGSGLRSYTASNMTRSTSATFVMDVSYAEFGFEYTFVVQSTNPSFPAEVLASGSGTFVQVAMCPITACVWCRESIKTGRCMPPYITFLLTMFFTATCVVVSVYVIIPAIRLAARVLYLGSLLTRALCIGWTRAYADVSYVNANWARMSVMQIVKSPYREKVIELEDPRGLVKTQRPYMVRFIFGLFQLVTGSGALVLFVMVFFLQYQISKACSETAIFGGVAMSVLDGTTSARFEALLLLSNLNGEGCLDVRTPAGAPIMLVSMRVTRARTVYPTQFVYSTYPFSRYVTSTDDCPGALTSRECADGTMSGCADPTCGGRHDALYGGLPYRARCVQVVSDSCGAFAAPKKALYMRCELKNSGYVNYDVVEVGDPRLLLSVEMVMNYYNGTNVTTTFTVDGLAPSAVVVASAGPITFANRGVSLSVIGKPSSHVLVNQASGAGWFVTAAQANLPVAGQIGAIQCSRAGACASSPDNCEWVTPTSGRTNPSDRQAWLASTVDAVATVTSSVPPLPVTRWGVEYSVYLEGTARSAYVEGVMANVGTISMSVAGEAIVHSARSTVTPICPVVMPVVTGCFGCSAGFIMPVTLSSSIGAGAVTVTMAPRNMVSSGLSAIATTVVSISPTPGLVLIRGQTSSPSNSFTFTITGSGGSCSFDADWTATASDYTIAVKEGGYAGGGSALDDSGWSFDLGLFDALGLSSLVGAIALGALGIAVFFCCFKRRATRAAAGKGD